METPAFVQNLIDQAKRIPWWGWVIIAVAVYVGYRLITSGSQDDGSSGDSSGSEGGGFSGLPAELPPLSGDAGNLGQVAAAANNSLGDLQNTFTYDYSGETGDPGQVPLYHPGEPAISRSGTTTTAPKISSLGEPTIQRSTTLSEPTRTSSPLSEPARTSSPVLISTPSPAPGHETNVPLSGTIQPITQPVSEPAVITPTTRATLSEPTRTTTTYTAPTYTAPQPYRPPTVITTTPTMRGQNVGLGGGPDSVEYHTQPGDTISDVATRFGVDNDDLYDANREVIESAAREHGLADSAGGWYLPGVPGGLTLKIPSGQAA